ncbi:hypothetical protein [Pseudomonas abietaniphila]|uniref:hypothetical protein n=1 Tax=Pseudomonas abietaniphila TaxID=89065 RepID=UPI000784CD8E|nr:hypothetical protein [Pseudomonas abietaniphila]
MTCSEKIVQAIANELFGKNFIQYSISLNKPINADKDSYARARNALAKLEASDRSDVINFLKVVITDSASVIFGTLDGVHFPDDIDGRFLVMYEGGEIQGDLQDLFIEKAQDDHVY